MNWLSITALITVGIGFVCYCFGVAKEPLDTKEFSYRRIFAELFTDPTKKVRKIGTILIYAGAILLMISELLKKIV